jgi:hypothetical protein
MHSVTQRRSMSAAQAAPQQTPVPDRSARLLAGQRLVWSRVRRLFPEHAVARAAGNGSLAISWSLQQQCEGQRHATPIVLRFERAWLDRLADASTAEQLALSAQADEMVCAGLVGYQLATRLPQRRVIVVG